MSEKYDACWVHQDFHCGRREKRSFAESGPSSRRKRRMPNVIERDTTQLEEYTVSGTRSKDSDSLFRRVVANFV